MSNVYVSQASTALRIEISSKLQSFFSDKNIENIQKMLKDYVLENSKQKISNQSIHELYIVMQYVYANHLKEELKIMNKYVIFYIGPMVVSNINQYNQYMRDICNIRQPMERSESTSITGLQPLEFQGF